VTEIKVRVYFLFSNELENNPYAAPLPVENKERAGISDKSLILWKCMPETIPLGSSTAHNILLFHQD
jgi:hypothetical protein